MSNLGAFFIALIFSCTAIGGFYFLIKKWSRFHLFFLGRVLKVFYGFILIWIIVFSLILTSDYFQQYLKYDRVRVINEFQNVKLGWSSEEVLFHKGKADFTGQRSDDKRVKVLIYGDAIIELLNERVEKIVFICDEENYLSSSGGIGAIDCGSDLDLVLDLYGEPENLSISKDKLKRFYNYPSYNVAFRLSKSKVEGLYVFDPKNLPTGIEFKTFEIEEIFDEVVTDFKRDVDKSESKKQASEPENENQAVVEDLDHCAPNISKAERLRRLASKGSVRETGYQTYTAGNFEISFSQSEVINCR